MTGASYLSLRAIMLASAGLIVTTPSTAIAQNSATAPASDKPEPGKGTSAPETATQDTGPLPAASAIGPAAPQSAPVADNQSSNSTTASAPPADASGPDKDIVVTGFRAATANALDQKRNAIEFSDTISTDGIDRVPDLNVGEALTRLPGIQLNRDQDNRSASVNIRGLPSNFSRITINGQSLADPSFGGATPLGSFNTDIFTAFTVIKSPLAETPAGGLSGIIDLRIADALKRKEGGSVRVSVEYDELGKRKSPSLNANYTKKFGSDFGVYGSVSYKKEDFRRDIFGTTFSPLTALSNPLFDPRTRANGQANTTTIAPTLANGQPNPAYGSAFQAPITRFLDYYGPATTTAITNSTCTTVALNGSVPDVCIGGGTGAKGTKGVYYPSRFDEMATETKGYLLSGALGAEWRIAPDLTFNLTGFGTYRDLNANNNSGLRVSNSNASPASLIFADTSSLEQAPDGRAYIDNYTALNSVLTTVERNRTSLYWTAGGNFNAEWTPEHWRLSTNVSFNEGKTKFTETNFSFTNNAENIYNPTLSTDANLVGGSVGNGIGTIFNLAGGNPYDAQFSFTNSRPIQTLVPRPQVVTPGLDSSANAAGQIGPLAPFYYGGCSTFFDNGVPLRRTNAVTNPFNAQCGTIIGATSGQFQALTLDQRTTSRVFTAGEDIERDIFHPILRSIKIGARYERNEFTSFNIAGGPLGLLALPNAQALLTSPNLFKATSFESTFFGGKIAYPPGYKVPDSAYILANLKPDPANLLANNFNTNNGPQKIGALGYVEDAISADTAGRNYSVNEDIYSAYGEMKLDTTFLGLRLRSNLGLRYEHTREAFSTIERQIIPPTIGAAVATQPAIGTQTVGAPYVCPVNLTGQAAVECNAKKSRIVFAPRDFSKDYNYILPAGIVSLNITNRLLLRAGYYDTYVRPQLGSLNGGRPVGFFTQASASQGTTNYTINLSPTNLKPYTASNWDVAAEWYNRPGSVIALTYWHKNVLGFTRGITDLSQLCPADGQFPGGLSLGGLRFDSGLNQCVAVAGDPNNPRADGTPGQLNVNVTGSENSPVPINISGIELNIQQNLGFLDIPIIKNLGGGFTFSRTNVSGTDQNGFPIVLGGVSKDNYNAILYYDSKLIGFRAVYNKRNPYLIQPISAANISSSTAASRGQLDLNLSVNPTRTLNISLDAFNVTNALFNQYNNPGLPSTLASSFYDGRTYTLSIRKRF